MDKLFFEISLESIEFFAFLEIASSISAIYGSQSLLYNYTSDLTNYNTKEKTFHSYDEFAHFLKSRQDRFNVLKLEQKRNELYIGFQYSRENYRIYGKVLSPDLFRELIILLSEHITCAYIHNDADLTLSRTNSYRSWQRKLGEIPSDVIIINNPQSISERDKYLIDLESVPSHYHIIRNVKNLWFGACAEMYFSNTYYKYIPEEKWNDFTDCSENIVLENGIRKIKLYDNFDEYENLSNREKQWSFRNSLGIDEVAHRLMKKGKIT